MAIAMMQSARQNAGRSIDRYVIFTDQLDREVPAWIELVRFNSHNSNDKFENWSLKPKLFRHPAITDDIVLFLDADTTVYRDVIGLAFEWIQKHSLLLLVNFVPNDEPWGPYNLRDIYKKAGYDLRNIVLNSGVVGRMPDSLGKTFQTLWEGHMQAMNLEKYFSSPSYKLADEPYAGLAHQLAYLDMGLRLPEQNHPFSMRDYVFTVGANPKKFYANPGPVVHVPWYSEPIIRPAIIHWVECTQYLYYRKTMWHFLRESGLLPKLLPQLIHDEMRIAWKRLNRKLGSILGGPRDALG